MTALDRADFGGLLAVAAFVARRVGWDRFLKGVAPPVLRRIFEEWFWQAHGGQAEPAASAGAGEREWRTWLLMAGRGFGKTLAGAQWVHARAREHPGARIALVGWSVDEVRKVMIEGPGGLLAAARSGEPVLWNPTRGVVRFASGAEAFVYSAAAPEKLRGPEHDFAWCDELAKWDTAGSGQARGERVWDNLQMGLRQGTRPRLIVTTTPRAVALVRRVRALKGTVETNGRTSDNVHSAEAFRDWALETYGGTRLGRQELDGMLFDEPEGALWPREILERARVEMGTVTFPHAGDRSGGGLGKSNCPLRRVVVGVDPPASADGDACGIVVCGLGVDGVAYVLADCSVSGLRPEGWARAVAQAAADWGADRVIAEKNQGGDMVESVLRSVDAALPVKLVSASRGKVARAEPVAARFETGKARLAGRFPALEDELAGLTLGGGYEGPGRSPDRADAMVWAMSELIRPAVSPSVRAL
jgi:phage terminase large subunit-like protein